MEEKEIILKHYKTFDVPVKINKNYEETIERIRVALYFTTEDMNNIKIIFVEEDDCEDILDEDNIERAFDAKEWYTKKKAKKVGPVVDPNDNEKAKLKAENSQLKRQINNLEKSLQETINSCNEKYKKQLDELKNKFINELKQRETLNKNNIEQITKSLSEYAQSVVKSKVEGYNNNIQNALNSKIEQSQISLKSGINDISQALNDINNNKEEIKKQIDESNKNFSQIIEISKININDNQ